VTSVDVSPGKEIQFRPAAGLFGSPQRQKILLGFLLAVATVLLYYPVDSHPFVNYDDNLYITENPHVTSGLHWQNVKWAFTAFEQGNWHPLTWLSHALDCQLSGLNAAGHHDTNVIFHVLNVLLLFWVLQQATGYIGRSAMVAALFALHPVNVETVAWISERKNLLSMMFFLLALAAYRRYAMAPGKARYTLVAFFYALGLMSKPQVITLPCVLLLWDYWPLRRMFATREEFPSEPAGAIPGRTLYQLVLEKLPLLALSAVSAVITIKAQRAGNAMRWYPFPVRLENTIVAYARYVKNAFWPSNLAPLYPHPASYLPGWEVLTAFVFLLAVTTVVISEWRRRRYLAVGWFWFLGTLVPMIGLVQVGTQAMADRYVYLPFIGLFIMTCWSVADWTAKRRISTAWVGAASLVVLLALGYATRIQMRYWEDNVLLWTRTLQITTGNWLAEDNLAGALMDNGKLEAAIPHFRAAAAINPRDPVSHLDIGFYEQQHQNFPQAIEQYQAVLDITPTAKLRAEAYNNWALIDRDLGDYAAAREQFQKAVDLSPRYASAWIGLAMAARKTGDLDLAIQAYSRAMEIAPSDSGYLMLANVLAQRGRTAEAQTATQQAKRLSQNFPETQRAVNRMLAQ